MVATVPLPMLERADIQVEEKADVVLDEKETSESPEEPHGDQHEASSEPQVLEKEAILEELEDDPDVELVGDEAVNWNMWRASREPLDSKTSPWWRSWSRGTLGTSSKLRAGCSGALERWVSRS